MLQLGVAAALLSVGLPHGFLYMESHPPAKAWETYRVDESARLPLQPNPCNRRRPADSGRLATRAVVWTSENRSKVEQLVVYRSTDAARAAMRGLRADLKRCAKLGKGIDRQRYFSKATAVGDEGLRAGARYWEDGFQAVAVRRGAAVYVVGASAWPGESLPVKDFRTLIGQADKMTVKVCALPEARC
jgi:hypothetical protein